jgi:hypothetical protein
MIAESFPSGIGRTGEGQGATPVPELRLLITQGRKVLKCELKRHKITLGRARNCTVHLDVPWLADQHLMIENTDQVVRIRCCSPGAKAILSGAELTEEWALLPPSSQVKVCGPEDQELLITCDYTPPQFNAVMLHEVVSGGEELGTDLSTQMVTSSPLDQEGWMKAGPVDEVPGGLSPERPEPESAQTVQAKPAVSKFAWAVITSIMVITCGIFGSIFYNAYGRSVEDHLRQADSKWVEDHLALARESLQKGDYVAAKAALDAAEPVATRRRDFADELAVIARLRQLPEIRLGAAGQVRMEGRWLPAEMAKAWQAARERDDPQIAQLEQKALDAKKAGRTTDVMLACDDALALMDKEPFHPHPREVAIKALRGSVKTVAVSEEMIARGLVLVNGKWVTKEEKYEQDQLAKGLEKYRGQWLNKDEAFSARQADKGLLLVNGQWMTPDDKVAAYAATANDLKKNAYLESQAVLKKQSLVSADAAFQPYGSPDVQVDLKDGWYSVQAVVVTRNSYGARLRKTYHSKLRMIPDQLNVWESATTFVE